MLLTKGLKLEPMRVLHARKQVKQTEAGLSEPPSEIPLYYQRAISEWHRLKQPQRRCSYNWNAESKHYLVTSLVLPSQDDFSIGIGKCQDVSHSSDTVSETRNSYLLNQNSNSQFQNLGLHHLMVNMVPMTLFLNVYLFILSYTCVCRCKYVYPVWAGSHRRPGKDPGSLETGVTAGCKLHDLGAGNRTWVLFKCSKYG